MKARVTHESEAFTSWLRNLSHEQAEGFFSFVERELFPPDGAVPPSDGLPFELTEEVELAFHYANMDFWRLYREKYPGLPTDTP